jgi:hypothetical protein
LPDLRVPHQVPCYPYIDWQAAQGCIPAIGRQDGRQVTSVERSNDAPQWAPNPYQIHSLCHPSLHGD